jgi:glycosyltransferase involved in cell wall biosynthesis
LRTLSEAFRERVVLHDNIQASSLLYLYQRAQVAFLPLTDAVANNSILEALACGVPVVTTDVGGTRDYVTPDCGFLIAPGNTNIYTDRLMSLLHQEDLRLRMAKAARARAEQFSWDEVADTMIHLYIDLLSERQRRN